MNAPNVKVLKTAITIMTAMIIVGLGLLFYGIYVKSSKLMTDEQPTKSQKVETAVIDGSLLRKCKPRLVSVVGKSMYFAYDKLDDVTCPVAISIDRHSGNVLQVFSGE